MRAQDLGLDVDVAILPSEWPADGVARRLLPRDLSQFTANRGPQRSDRVSPVPFRLQVQNAGGGLIYFDETIDAEGSSTMLGLMDVIGGATDYAAFAASTDDPARDDYLN